MRTPVLLALGIALTLGTTHAGETVVVAGTGASQIMLRALAAAYSQAHPGTRVEVPDSVGTGGGIKAAAEGTADLGRVARPLKDKEKATGLEYAAFARVPVVFATHPSAGVKDLTTAQVLDLFAGKAMDWREVGGKAGRVRVVTRYKGESTLEALEKQLPGWVEITVTEKSKVSSTDPDNAENIAAYEGAVGFTTLDLAAQHGLTVISIDGVAPEAPAYPVFIDFGIVYQPEKLAGPTQDFFEYLYSPAAAGLIRQYGGTPLSR